MNVCTCCGEAVYVDGLDVLCDDCEPDGDCGPNALHCVCDRSCEVLIAEYRATGESEQTYPERQS